MLLGATDPMPRDAALEPVPNSTNAWTLDADADAALTSARLAQPTLDAYKAAQTTVVHPLRDWKEQRHIGMKRQPP